MQAFYRVLVLLTVPLFAGPYLSNESCKECHFEIYEEYTHSWHAKSYHNDTLHQNVAKKVPVYDCGRCHMPSAKNLSSMAQAKAWPKGNASEKEAISCFYCHTIAYLNRSHRFNTIVSAKQTQGYKPTIYGTLQNPDESDKHAMVHSPIYTKYACTGCHGFKKNGNDVLIFKTTDRIDQSEACIQCHMPKTAGAPEKMNKKGRTHHHSHEFLGIHDASMRQKSVDLSIDVQDRHLAVMVHNKMGHPLIIHPARLKYLKISLVRDGKSVWQNFTQSPRDDAQAVFTIDFLDGNDHWVGIPYFAQKRGFVNNIEANGTKTLHYSLPVMHKNDRIIAQMFVILAKPSCAAAAGVEERGLTTPLLMKEVIWKKE